MLKRLLIISIAVIAMIILVSCMGEEYGNEARSFLRRLMRII